MKDAKSKYFDYIKKTKEIKIKIQTLVTISKVALRESNDVL